MDTLIFKLSLGPVAQEYKGFFLARLASRDVCWTTKLGSEIYLEEGQEAVLRREGNELCLFRREPPVDEEEVTITQMEYEKLLAASRLVKVLNL